MLDHGVDESAHVEADATSGIDGEGHHVDTSIMLCHDAREVGSLGCCLRGGGGNMVVDGGVDECVSRSEARVGDGHLQ